MSDTTSTPSPVNDSGPEEPITRLDDPDYAGPWDSRAAGPSVCFHPRTCPSCHRLGRACTAHHPGDAGHESCVDLDATVDLEGEAWSW